jgi:hypothetical protein
MLTCLVVLVAFAFEVRGQDKSVDNARGRVRFGNFLLVLNSASGAAMECTDTIAESARLALEDCLIDFVDSRCYMDPLYLALSGAGCSGKTVHVQGGVMDFTGSDTAASNTAVTACVRMLVSSATCLDYMQAFLPDVQEAGYQLFTTPSPTTTTHLSTRSPTPNPTVKPTRKPTNSPAKDPVSKPTKPPTMFPASRSPSQSPSLSIQGAAEAASVQDTTKAQPSSNNTGMLVATIIGGILIVALFIAFWALDTTERNLRRPCAPTKEKTGREGVSNQGQKSIALQEQDELKEDGSYGSVFSLAGLLNLRGPTTTETPKSEIPEDDPLDSGSLIMISRVEISSEESVRQEEAEIAARADREQPRVHLQVTEPELEALKLERPTRWTIQRVVESVLVMNPFTLSSDSEKDSEDSLGPFSRGSYSYNSHLDSMESYSIASCSEGTATDSYRSRHGKYEDSLHDRHRYR